MFDAYLAREVDDLFARAGHPAEPEHRRRAVLRAVRPLAPAVHAALVAQNQLHGPCAAREAHLDRLARGAAAVVTGQQVGLFLGPLYTVYKAASAVVIARALEAETGQPVVPIFWLQTEDHDLPEIATTYVRSAQREPHALRLPADAEDRRAIAHRVLPPEIDACLARLRDVVASLPHGPAHLEHLTQHYRPGARWSTAFAGVLAALFADEGLVLIDPRDAALARLAAPIHRRALVDAAGLSAALLARSEALKAAGFEPAVHVRPGAPLSFFHRDAAEGPRHRLTPTEPGGAFDVHGSGERLDLAQLVEILERDPLRFSTSALLRPILQDTLLPTAAYVGGPGEIAYFAQLGPLYAAYGLPMPLIVPRARFRVVDDKMARTLARLGARAADLAAPEDVVLRRLQTERPATPAPELEARVMAPVAAALATMRAELEGWALDGAIDKAQAAIASSVAKLADKYDKALLHRDGERVEEVRRLQAQLHPNGAPQERIFGLSYYAARYGERAFVTRVLDGVRPFDPTIQDLEP